MNEIINIQQVMLNNLEVNAVNARDLHQFLKSKQAFANWIKSRIEKYGFENDSDYTLNKFITRVNGNNGGGCITKIDYYISLDMAKELAMVENNDKGRLARKYFIECERKLKTNNTQIPNFANPAIAARAWADEVEKRLNVEKELKIATPKIEFAETIEKASNGILVRELAYIAQNESNIKIGEKHLWRWMRNHGYIHKYSTRPMQTALERGLFMVQERAIGHTHGIEVHFTTRVTGKGQLYFINKLKTEFNH